MWDRYPELRPDYEDHVERTKIIEKVDEEILAQQLKEAARIAAKKAEEEALKKSEEEAKLNEEINNIDVVVDRVPINIH